MRIKTGGAAETPNHDTVAVRVESASARAKRSHTGGESNRAFARVYRMGGRARVVIDVSTDGEARFDLERDEAVKFARALLEKVGLSLEA